MRLSILISILMLVCIALPDHAMARAGGGRSSMGSMGTHTYQPSSAQPIQRSMTPQSSPANAYNRPGIPAPAPTGGGFWSGIAGGFLGAGLAEMLFGHGGGMGGGGFGLLPLLLIAGIGYLFYRRMRSPGLPVDSGYGAPYMAPATPLIDVTQALTITDADKDMFEQALQQIQHSWSEGDLAHLRGLVTPEMLQYFSEELSANSSRGLANKVSDVKLVDANLVQAWHEYELDYATVRLRWSANDAMVRLDRNPGDADYVSSGSLTQPDTAEEQWTFARAAGGRWLLSAIQQV